MASASTSFVLTRQPTSWQLRYQASLHFYQESQEGKWFAHTVQYATRAKLDDIGFPLNIATDMTLRELAQAVAEVLECSPSLTRAYMVYNIGDTGYAVIRKHQTVWCIKPPVAAHTNKHNTQRRICATTLALLEQHDNQFSTRRSAVDAFIGCYTVAVQHEQTRSLRSKIGNNVRHRTEGLGEYFVDETVFFGENVVDEILYQADSIRNYALDWLDRRKQR